MDKTYYWYNIYLRGEIVETEQDYWTLQPTKKASLVYSIITPFVCFLGICGNLVCLVVLLRRELKASIYTYLSVMATADLLKCMGIFFSGISGLFWDTGAGGFAVADALIASPLGGMISSLSTMATVAVSMDRAVYLWNPTNGTRPKFCYKKIARRVMALSLIFAVVFNLPYCFIFKLDENDEIVTTEFFHSEYYAFHNWLGFIIFGIIPLVVLSVVNTMLIVAIKKAWKLRSQSRKQCGKGKCDRQFWDQVYLTMTLVAVVFLFLIGEIPLHLLSRKSAITFVYNTNMSYMSMDSNFVNTLREVCIILSALHVSVNFILYCAFCPPFVRTLKKMVTRKSKKKKKSTQRNIFAIVDGSKTPFVMKKLECNNNNNNCGNDVLNNSLQSSESETNFSSSNSNTLQEQEPSNSDNTRY